MEDLQQQGAKPCLLPGDEECLQSVNLIEKRAQFKEELEEESLNTFHFDRVYYPSEMNAPSTDLMVQEQNEIYESIGSSCLANLFDSYNSCVFAYGQTGSGKTHTMMGAADVQGIIPRFCRQLLTRFEELPELSRKCMRLQASFVEIYCENLYDLLTPEEVKKHSWVQNGRTVADTTVNRKKLALRQHPVHGLTVAGAQTYSVSTWAEVESVLQKGMASRSTAATSMNDQSSRSHAMFQITMEMQTNTQNAFSTATIRFVDLAGSENLKKSGSDGARMHESIHINTSLLSLRRVIDQLLEGKAMPAYRDSKLTRLLSDCLGGNSKTWFLACVSPSVVNLEETKNTLRYAAKARRIVNHVKRNMDVGARLEEDLLHLREELALARGSEVDELKTLISQYEKTQTEMTLNMEQLLSKQEEAAKAIKEAELQAELKVQEVKESSQRARAVHSAELEKMQQGLKKINDEATSYKLRLEAEVENVVATQKELDRQKQISEEKAAELTQLEKELSERERRAAEEKRAWEELANEMENEMERRLANWRELDAESYAHHKEELATMQKELRESYERQLKNKDEDHAVEKEGLRRRMEDLVRENRMLKEEAVHCKVQHAAGLAAAEQRAEEAEKKWAREAEELKRRQEDATVQLAGDVEGLKEGLEQEVLLKVREIERLKKELDAEREKVRAERENAMRAEKRSKAVEEKFKEIELGLRDMEEIHGRTQRIICAADEIDWEGNEELLALIRDVNCWGRQLKSNRADFGYLLASRCRPEYDANYLPSQLTPVESSQGRHKRSTSSRRLRKI
eukprot:TRINITY_DN1264_c0_g1_i1.p1 TRINITY_DN1264_c0_g1~~TRINITY_DN1264_c0_g1_i1.p1  ORF type:complete len:927 (+),score=425.52 TRINITY_DN1264_c0_g1_i1:379-2781(+)